MNIYDFIDSNAIRNYLKEINYEFNSMEAAYIVWHNKKYSQEEKNIMLEWILKNMDNHKIDFWDIDVFTLIKECLKIVKRLSEKNSPLPKIRRVSIRRVLSKDEPDILAIFNNMGINIPVPFAKGDIVSTEDGIPILLLQKSGWERNMNKFECENIETWKDMIYQGYIFDKNENVLEYVCGEEGCLYLDYYRGELKGKERILKLLSNYYKNQFDPAILINTYISLSGKNVDNTNRWRWIHNITEEELNESGILEAFPICKEELKNFPF